MLTTAIINQKGGTGKTTTTINLGRALSKQGLKVMLLDLDPQGNLTYAFGINQVKHTICDAMEGKVKIQNIGYYFEEMYIVPTDLSTSKFHIKDQQNTEYLLKNVLSEVEDFDQILIDCPPSLSALTINALCAAQNVLIPMQLDVFSIQGLQQMLQIINQIKGELNPNLNIAGVLPVMVDNRKLLTREIREVIEKNFNLHVFKSAVRTNVKAAEAPSFGQSVLEYAPKSNSAIDYMNMGAEWMKLTKTLN